MKKILITLILVFVVAMVSAQTYNKDLEMAAKKELVEAPKMLIV